MEDQIFDYLVIAAFVLLLGVSIGIGYLTVVEWRDRRRRDNEAKATRTPRPNLGRKPSASTADKKSDKKVDQKQKGKKQKAI